MIYEEARTLATADAQRLQGRIESGADIAPETVGAQVAARALANALVIVVQGYLEQTSNEHEVELFFEESSRQPADVLSWPITILAALLMRPTPREDLDRICERAVEVATRHVRTKSPLAWG